MPWCSDRCVLRAEDVLAKELDPYGPGEEAVWKWGMGRLSPLLCGLSFALYPTVAMLHPISWSAALVEGLLESLLKQGARNVAVAPLRWLWVSGPLRMTPAFFLLVLTILAMFSQRYSQAFPLDTVNRGEEFVATLRLVYPHADKLCGKDFDWLFDCPQTKQFLEWFCSTVGEENVLSPAEVEAYDALLAAGKPILEGDALEQALRMCHQVPQLPSMMPDDESLSSEALQQELQELKDYHDRQLWRHSKLQVWAANLQRELRCLEEEEEVVKQDLRKAQMDLEVEAFQTRAVLSQISKAAKQLAEWHGDVGKGRLPALMCEMDLGPYLELEQQATNMFEGFIQGVLPGSVQAPDAQGKSAQGKSSLKERLEAVTQMDSDWNILEGRRGAPYQECANAPWGVAAVSQGILVRGSNTELLVEGRNGREVLSMGDEEERDSSQEATERVDAEQTTMLKSLGTDGDELLEDQDHYWKELSRMEKAHICAQREVIVTSAKVEGNCAALEWAQRTLEALKDNQVGPVLPFLHHPLWQGLPVLQAVPAVECWSTADMSGGEGVAEPGSASGAPRHQPVLSFPCTACS